MKTDRPTSQPTNQQTNLKKLRLAKPNRSLKTITFVTVLSLFKHIETRCPETDQPTSQLTSQPANQPTNQSKKAPVGKAKPELKKLSMA